MARVSLLRASGSLAATAIVVSACSFAPDQTEQSSELLLLTRLQDAPTWAVPFGEEVWSHEPGVDLTRTIERVQHAMRRDPATGLLGVQGRGYAAAFDGSGLRLSTDQATHDVRLHTVQITSGDDVLYSERGVQWSLLGNTAQARLAGSIVEHYETLADGVEMAWIFREHHAGDLTIDLAIDGLNSSATKDRSTQLVDSSGRVHAHIGAATLVDANGRRWPVETESTVGGVRWRVAADLLAEATYPVVLDPLIGPEILVADPSLSTSQLSQINPSVAASSNGYLVAWSDSQENLDQLRAARLSSAGVLLDPEGIYLAQGRPSGGARIASNGTDYLVAWAGADTTAVRVSSTGVVLDTTPIIVSTASGSLDYPAVTSNGTDYLVAWTQFKTSMTKDVYASRISAAGVVLDPSGIAISTASAQDQWLPAAASNGSGYLVAWGRDDSTTWRDIYAARIADNGTVLDPEGFVVSNAPRGQSWPAVTSNGTDYFVAWEDDRNNTAVDIYGSRVTALGQVSDPSGIAVSTAASTQTQPRLAWNGSNYLAVWEDDRFGEFTLFYDIYAARIATDGTVVDPQGIAIATGPTLRAPSVAANDGNYLIAWQESGEQTSWDIYARRFNASMQPIEPKPFPVALSPNAYAPTIASNGTTFLVAWQDSRAFENTSVDIVGARLSSTGTILDPNGIVISNAAGPQLQPTIASDGTDYLVAWEDNRSGLGGDHKDVYAARVSSAGLVLDSGGLPVCTQPHAQAQVTLASDGTDYLLAWADGRGLDGSDVYVARVTSGGTVLDPDGVLFALGAQASQIEPTLASNGSSYLLAWTSAGSVFARRLTNAGVPDTSSVVATFTTSGHSPSATSNGTDYLVAWKVDTNGPTLFATRVSAAGALADTAPIQLFTSRQGRSPAAASDGTDYLVAWQYEDGQTEDLYATRISAGGSVWDPTGLPISTATIRETNPALAYNVSSGGYAIAYEARQLAYVRQLQFCGDGQVEGTETCDDGAMVGGDGCSASCRVEPGYACSGTPSACTDVNECATNNGGCSPNALCTNSVGSFSCACNSGYTGDGLTCVDIDECATNHGGCSNDAACNNASGSFTCTCNPGYAGNGVTCADIDECATNNGGCEGTCTNTVGSYACSCAEGFVLNANGHACDDVDECATNNGNCEGTCRNTPGSYACSCPAGFSLDANGHGCSDIDECATNNGGCDQTCTNSSGAFACSCNAGYSLSDDGVTCTPSVSCSDATDGCPDPTDDTEPDDSGCGCRTNDPSQSVWSLLVLGVLLRRRTRQRSRSRPCVQHPSE